MKKDARKKSLLTRHAILAARARHRGNPCVLWRTFAADIMACVLKNGNRRNDVRHYRLVHSGLTLTSLTGLSSNLAYITSVFIGYIGTDSIGSLIKRFAAKKAGVEDGRNQ